MARLGRRFGRVQLVPVIVATALVGASSATPVAGRRTPSPAGERRFFDALPQRPADDALVKALGGHLDRVVAADRFSGAVLLARRGTILFEHAYGEADKTFDVPNRLDTRFNLGSMGKMFTGVAILQLVQAGKLSLDDKLVKDLPDYPNADVANEVTIFQLLTHTSGLGDFFGPEFAAANMERFQTLESLVPLFAGKPLRFPPGTRWAYSNAGFIVLGLVVEHVTGESYYDYVREHVFDPAGMRDTGNWRTDAVVPNLAIGYTNLPLEGPGAPPEPLKERRMNTFILQRGGSAGGGCSTVLDLLKFSEALQGRKLLNEQYTTMDLTGRVDTGQPDTRYGFGMEEARVDGVRVVGHGGGAPGINSKLDMYPDLGYTVAVMGNYDPPAAERVANWIQWQLVGGDVPRKVELPPSALQAYAGDYSLPFPPGLQPPPGAPAPVVTVSIGKRGELIVALGPQSDYFVAFSTDEFFSEDVPSTRLVFERDVAGRITGLTITGSRRPTQHATKRP